MTILEIILIIISGALLFSLIFIIKSKINNNNNFNHVEALYHLETTEITIDNFTAHRIRFDMSNLDNWKKYQNVSLKFNKETNTYILVIKYFSEEHKEETLNRIGVELI